jgi:hypothetical protein
VREREFITLLAGPARACRAEGDPEKPEQIVREPLCDVNPKAFPRST